jgi:serine/threonine-protein kinase
LLLFWYWYNSWIVQPSSRQVCPQCSHKADPDWRICPACGTPLDAGAETRTIFNETSGASVEEGRFPAGSVLAGRYRVLGRIGQGGMGEVYRAYDIMLNQPVALKFLGRSKMSEAALARFRNEVRIARQVSHPNVCRVYDIGFIEGFHFLSMEYLDGEDLASLIRRIGRLPQDKAIEFTRKICAGLSAAHERGVLHRDLKPANIMIDGRGQVRITDFGLAALAQEVALGDIRSGTPAYLSPEQKAGREVTIRSDIYSLGLTLHEMFTGKRRSETQSNPSEIVKDLDPAVERVILRCLEEDPKRRPSTALSVAMALPGGDPIAAALAAGETPSPEMVAASGEKEGMSARAAVLCFGAVVAALITISFTQGGRFLLARAPLPIPPDGLAFRAQETLKQLGYMDAPRRTAYGFACCDSAYLWSIEQRKPPNLNEILASHQPAVIRFWYRQHRDEIWPDQAAGAISYNSPANIDPGMIRLALDAKARLIALEVRPWVSGSAGQAPTTPVKAPDAAELFAAAGLDPSRFSAAEPRQIPPMSNDTRMAWTGTYGEGRTEHIRLEAAFWQGRPVYFTTIGDWPGQSGEQPRGSPVTVIAAVLFIVILGGSAALAWRNLRLGRGDRRGATRIAGATFVLSMAAWTLQASHVRSYWELGMLIYALSLSCFYAAFVWSLYVAVEPYVRRHWPDSLISWTRLLTGQIRNPLVASHVIIGIFVQVAFAVLSNALGAPFQRGVLLPLDVRALNSAADSAAVLLVFMFQALICVIGFILLIVLLRMLVRRLWVADVLASLLFATLFPVTNPAEEAIARVATAINGYALLWMLRRFGLLSVLAGIAAPFVALSQPFGTWGAWYANREFLADAAIAGTAAWALWVILSAPRRPIPE